MTILFVMGVPTLANRIIIPTVDFTIAIIDTSTVIQNPIISNSTEGNRTRVVNIIASIFSVVIVNYNIFS